MNEMNDDLKTDNDQTLLQKAIRWAHNNKLVVLIIIIVTVFAQLKPLLQSVDFAYTWITEKYNKQFPESFENNNKTLNILLLRFDRVEKDLNTDLNIEEAIYNRFVELMDKNHALIQIIYDNSKCPKSYEEAKQYAKKRGAKMVIFGEYYEKSSQAEVKYIFLTQEINLLMFSDSTFKFEAKIEEQQDGVITLSHKNSTGILKFDNLAEISDLSNTKLLNKVDRLVYTILSLNEYDQQHYRNSYDYACSIPLSNFNDDIGVYYLQLLSLEKMKDYDKMLNVCNKLIKLKPNRPNYYFNRAGCYHQLKKTNEALKDYTRCLVLDSNYENALINRGKIFADIKQYKKALVDFNNALSKNSKNAITLINRGVVLLELKLYDEALEDFESALKIDKNLSDAYMNIGVCKRRMGMLSDAMNNLTKAISLDSNNVLAYFNRGVLNFFELKDVQNAISDFAKVIEKENKFFKAYLYRYYCYIELQNNEKQIEDLNALIKLDSNNYEFYNARGYNYVILTQYQKAIEDFDKSLAINKDYSFAYNNRGWAYANIEQYEMAFEDFRISQKLNPENSYLYTFRGFTYYKMKRYKEALKDLRKALAKNKEYRIEIRNAIQDIEKQ